MVFGPLPVDDEDDGEDRAKGVLTSILSRFRRKGQAAAAEKPAPVVLMPENQLAWAVIWDVFSGRQFAMAGLGGVVGFRYEAVIAVIGVRVPAEDHGEVWQKFKLVEPYALHAIAEREKRARAGRE